jgi:parvulin-like peptidyl-prolyl isomerase
LKNFPEKIQEQIAVMNVGEVSRPVRTDDSYYLVNLLDKRITQSKGRKIDKDPIYQKLFMEKLNAKAKNYLENLKDSTYVERM